jgi:general secretion pathway protein L
LLVLQVLALNALALQQRRQIEAQRGAIAAVLQQTFPEQRLVVDAPLQMQRAVDDLARARGVASDLSVARVFSILGAQAPANLHLTAIEQDGRQLVLKAQGLDAAQAQPLLAALDARGLRAQLQGEQLTITEREAR